MSAGEGFRRKRGALLAGVLSAARRGRSQPKVWLSVGGLIALLLGLGGVFVYQTTGSLFGFGQTAVARVSLTSSDLPSGWSRCPRSGRIPDIAESGNIKWVSDAWTTLQTKGATDAELVIYTDHPDRCSKFFSTQELSLAGSGNDSARVALSIVAEFRTVAEAVAEFQSNAEDCAQQAECTSGMSLGLGPNSKVVCGKASCGGTAAEWQRNALVVSFLSNSTDSVAKNALLSMDARAQRVAPTAAA